MVDLFLILLKQNIMKTLVLFALVLLGVAHGQQNGRTTRYWDCCKPSCGWGDKGPVNKPVDTCEADGVRVIDVNAQSGCNGGPSYTCNNNQPWAVNDNLAYGFAAAYLSNQGEWDWCCACYELNFLTGPVQGKKLIVQVTNTGGDLGENHFDILMPGGGVGLFNGCQPQWGAPDAGWGDRYGGVRTIEECEQLPSQIREGCRWRFNWFRNADNPDVSFQRVQCPAEITSKSNCIRNDLFKFY
ncbi:endoglucanase-5 [Folsomia candida]|uniref:endoglucanase-5 n=1 Tax=Folsomia candida TaxID=158441 RepID=UPI000B8EF416|nr:endoglucanase-5 [Folsomia candida]